MLIPTNPLTLCLAKSRICCHIHHALAVMSYMLPLSPPCTSTVMPHMPLPSHPLCLHHHICHTPTIMSHLYSCISGCCQAHLTVFPGWCYVLGSQDSEWAVSYPPMVTLRHAEWTWQSWVLPKEMVSTTFFRRIHNNIFSYIFGTVASHYKSLLESQYRH